MHGLLDVISRSVFRRRQNESCYVTVSVTGDSRRSFRTCVAAATENDRVATSTTTVTAFLEFTIFRIWDLEKTNFTQAKFETGFFNFTIASSVGE